MDRITYGKVTPPSSRPTRNMIVNAKIKKLPSQSIALKPLMKGVFGLWTSRAMSKIMKVTPDIGLLYCEQCQKLRNVDETYRLIQKHHLHDTSSVKVPPIIGPTPPATAQTTSKSPR